MFLIIALGYFLKRINLITETFAVEGNKIAFKVFLPCLLFTNIYSADIHTAFNHKLLLFTLITLIITFIVIWFLVVIFFKSNYQRGVIIQGMYRSNFVILGLPVATNICGSEAAATIGILLAIVLPCYNVFSIIALEYFNTKHLLETKQQTADIKWSATRQIIKHIATNQLIIATFLAFVFILLKIDIPNIIMQPINCLADVATAMCLMILGSFFKISDINKSLKELCSVVIVKLLLLPLILTAIAIALGFRGAELVSLLAIFATPTAVAGFTMAQTIGGDSDLAANIVVVTSFLSMFTLFIFTYILISLGFI